MFDNYVNSHNLLKWKTKKPPEVDKVFQLKERAWNKQEWQAYFSNNCYLKIAFALQMFANRSNIKENFKFLYMSYRGSVFNMLNYTDSCILN